MTEQDVQQLELLSIFHYVVGGLAALVACIPLVHFTVGLAMTSGWIGHGEAPAFVGCALMVVAGLVVLSGWGLAAALIVAGRFLARHVHYTYCLVLGAIACVLPPFGTVLGIFTIVVLSRPSVRAGFDAPVPGEAAD